MPQASDELRAEWEHVHGDDPECICELAAVTHLWPRALLADGCHHYSSWHGNQREDHERPSLPSS